MRVLFGLAVVAITLLPSFASAAGYTHTETVTVAGTNPVRMTAREFTFYAYPGQHVEASLTYTSTGGGDVDLRIVPPGGSCSVPPLDAITALDCVVFTAGGRLADPLCTGTTHDPLQFAASGSASASADVTRAGPWRAVVLFPVGAVQTRYTLTLSVDGQDPGVSGPVATSYLVGNPACRLP